MQAIRIIEIPDGRMGSIITPPEAGRSWGTIKWTIICR